MGGVTTALRDQIGPNSLQLLLILQPQKAAENGLQREYEGLCLPIIGHEAHSGSVLRPCFYRLRSFVLL